MISASCLCLVATQAVFRRIRIFQFFALISSFSVGFEGFDKIRSPLEEDEWRRYG